MRDLQGQNALVTGASGGLGRHIAAALAAAGANVAISGRSAAALERLAESLDEVGVKTASVPVDLLEPSATALLVERASQALGPLSVVVNGAGVEIASSFTVYSREQLETVLTLDLVVPMLLIREVLPGMLERGSGHVVNIGSLAGKGALPYGVPYAAAKWGLAGLTQSLRAEYAGSGVGFSLVIPGFVTEEGIFARHEADGVRAPVIFGTTTPKRVARAVVRAISEDAPEILVTPRPLRPFLAFADLAPRLGERLAARLGVANASRTVAQLHGRLAGEVRR